MPELWESRELLNVTYADEAVPQDNFWLQYFPQVFTSTAEEIIFNQLPIRDRRLAAFVPANVAGRVYGRRGIQLQSFRPAYVKPKHIIDPSKPFVRDMAAIQAAFANNGGTPPSPQALFDQAIAANLIHERELIERRWEWMACQAVNNGYVEISGADYPYVKVDFNRDARLTRLLTGLSAWGASAGDPLDDLRDMRRLSFSLSRAPVRQAVFGLAAWDAFSSTPAVKDLLNKVVPTSASQMNISGINDGTPVEYMGYLAGGQGQGRLDMWTYSNQYENDNGTLVDFMDERDVVGVGSSINGVRAFGAIKDLHSLEAVPIFPRNYLEQGDPANFYTLSQSAPLMVPANANNTFRIRVLP